MMKHFNWMLLFVAAISFTVTSCSKDHTNTEPPTTGPGTTTSPIEGTWYVQLVDANIVAGPVTVDETSTGLSGFEKFTFNDDGTYSLVKQTANGEQTVNGTYELNNAKDTLRLTQTTPIDPTDVIGQTIATLFSQTGMAVNITDGKILLSFDATDFTVSLGGNDVTADKVQVEFELKPTPAPQPSAAVVGTWNVSDVAAAITVTLPPGGTKSTFDQSVTGLDKYKTITFNSDGTYSLVRTAASGDTTINGTYELSQAQDSITLKETGVETDPIAALIAQLFSNTGMKIKVSDDMMVLTFNATNYSVDFGGTDITADAADVRIALDKKE